MPNTQHPANPKHKVVQYADDGIIYDYVEDVPNLTSLDPRTNIQLNMNKSHVVRENGIWKRPLKFLGMIYFPPGFHNSPLTPGNNIEGGVLHNSTRNFKPYELESIDLVNQAEKYDLKETS